MQDSRGICLLLGGGGARGFAQLGVLDRLLEAGVPISSVVGCSVGGLIAAFFAAGGYSPEEMCRFGSQLNPKVLLQHALAHWVGWRSKTEEWAPGRLLRLLETCSFHRLHHGVRALGIVAFDLVRRKEILFTGSGSHAEVTVAEAATGGAAIPLVFPPKRVRHGDETYLLVDAGFRSLLPLHSTLHPPFADPCVVAVDLSSRLLTRRRAPRLAGSAGEEMRSRLVLLQPASRVGTIFFRSRDALRVMVAGRETVTGEVLRDIERKLA
jgi:predicted acylesterase/phospholipase RssA